MQARTLAVASLLFFVPLSCKTQNLVANGSFEEISACPQYPAVFGYQTGARPTGWFSAWHTPDYFNACVDTLTSVPSNWLSYQPAEDGDAYSGLFTFNYDDGRELIATELLQPLTIGQTYYCSFWVSPAYGGTYFIGGATNNMGMLFTMYSSHWTYQPWTSDFQLRNFAHIRSEEVISDSVAWTLVSGSFLADSAYRFMILGNQYSNANTEVVLVGPNNPNYAYLFVDNVCVSVNPLGCPLATGQVEERKQMLRLAPNPCAGQLTVEFLEPMEDLSVKDVTGRHVLEKRVFSDRMTLDLSAQPNGFYVIQINGKGVRHSECFVVQH